MPGGRGESRSAGVNYRFRGERLYEGKAKVVYATGDSDVYILTGVEEASWM